MKKLIVIGLSTLLFFSLIFIALLKIGPLFNLYIVAPSTQSYVKIAINQMDMHGLYAKGDKWERAKDKALNDTQKAQDYKDTHTYLEEALKVAGGKHSFLYTKKEKMSQSGETQYPKITLKNDILTIKLPGFMGNEKEGKRYANEVSKAIQRENYKGIIIDLRDNYGGDMGPMIASISPLLKNGTLLTYVDGDDNKTDVNLDGSQTENGGTPIELNNVEKVKNVPIAILINKKTASSGEITALAFKGAKNIKYFGENSGGYTSANTTIKLYDGTLMNLTTHRLEDKQGNVYENNPIIPDVKSNNPEEDATKWLKLK
ncbi:S41 family peptidase [Staphylococcus hyicus]|uniref:S41 family peptidase n=3 Tax=Staphylococcus hyicus TaxID=1284 RepID=A0ACD5FIU6_STAHY|nr:S41 family peptidase [Staphylococcus hyicus]MDP4464259.1 S41 family peptidase [Staphylococcus hyicus]MDP4469150.1 S41 family peptidase [Staphylococcus hyicus]RIO46186.1 nisin-resistance protein [Staphylococcus hyicus]